ncbi:MAG: hypothetical protein IJ773_13385 [Lachnospiraceae bacterium]|nr:hypothetical protein [Lachnospiraceae bacterium]
MIIKEIDVKSVMTKSNLPVSDFSVNPYVGCTPIFPGITDVKAIIEAMKDRCNLIWLENLNLRGDYKVRILEWVHEHHPDLDELYHHIYSKSDRTYWSKLDAELREYAATEGFPYVRDDDSKRSDFGELPIIANYFYHEEVKKSAKKEK